MLTFGDLFAGGGGTTTGAFMVPGVKVLWALNHSELAIKTHEDNHPETTHYKADIRQQDEKELSKVDVLWASLECTNFSVAKGGKPKNEDSRTLAWELPRYIIHCQPKIIMIENVREFMSWGPIDSKGRPVKMKNGTCYEEWIEGIKSLGYEHYDYRIMNSADYGAHTSRRRFFGVFCKKGIKFEFPEPTHSKEGGFFCEKWKSCKELIDLENTGNSIFGRKKPLVDKSIRRIAAGIKKFYPEMSFILKYYGTGENLVSLDQPLHTITTKDRHMLVSLEKKQFITKHYNSGDNPESQIQSLEQPAATITGSNKLSLVTVEKRQFISDHIWGASNQEIDKPLNALVTKPLKQLVTFIASTYNSNNNPGANVSSTDKPLPAITSNFKHQVVAVENTGIDFDVKVRFLNAKELSDITGFPKDYKYNCSNANALWMIGNTVPPVLSKVLVESAKKAICR